MIYVLDRIEGDIAVLEDDNRKNHEFPVSLIPTGAREGDCLFMLESGGFAIDKDETEARRAKNRRLQEMLFKK